MTLDDVSISNAKQDGFAYIRAGNGSTPDSGRHDRRGVDPQQPVQQQRDREQPGGSGRADILLFGYNQDLTITNVVIGSPGAFAQKAIQMRGIEGGDVVNVGPYDQAGDVAINNLTITGAYGQDVIAFYRIAGFDSFTGANNSVNVTRSVNASSNATLEPWAVINMDEVGGSVDLSSFFSSASNLASANGGPIVHRRGSPPCRGSAATRSSSGRPAPTRSSAAAATTSSTAARAPTPCRAVPATTPIWSTTSATW